MHFHRLLIRNSTNPIYCQIEENAIKVQNLKVTQLRFVC